jgi:hypothetical protein
MTQLAAPVEFICTPLGTPSVPGQDRAALVAFQQKASRLQRAMLAANTYLSDLRSKLGAVKASLMQSQSDAAPLILKVRQLEVRLTQMKRAFTGDEVISKRNDIAPAAILTRLNSLTESFYSSFAGPTGTQQKAYQLAVDDFDVQYQELKKIAESELPALYKEMNAAGAPYIPGQMPEWKKE